MKQFAFSANNKTRGKSQKWEVLENGTFLNVSEFDESAISKEIKRNYKVFKSNKTSTSIVKYYICKNGRRAQFKCNNQMRVKRMNDGSFVVESNKNEHDHDRKEKVDGKRNSFSHIAEEKIREFLQLEVKTKTIRRKLIELKLIDPQTSDASFHGKIHRMKQKQKMTATNTSLKELKDYVKELYSKENNQVYVVKSEFNEITDRFLYILSNKKLMQVEANNDGKWMLACDATYKLNIEG